MILNEPDRREPLPRVVHGRSRDELLNVEEWIEVSFTLRNKFIEHGDRRIEPRKGTMKLLLTSAGIKNTSIHDALVGLLTIPWLKQKNGPSARECRLTRLTIRLRSK